MELADLMIEEQVAVGVFLGALYDSVIELQAMRLGHELSREAQERATRKVAANCASHAACPEYKTRCEVCLKKCKVIILSGPVELAETVADCPKCRRSFFSLSG